ncbi:cytochrome b561 [Azorhizobium sp. AG788]|uniref:cytochrome b n=1 Tax=Azorhizobium sp. AG788 TaxID=2183897 RepID=UPI001060A35F|nr:cytochrome b/b6 domain-containing protein [Azorhizobium sp. AG788]TDT92514.1 cytochrome b561 [Azorhizobium sp. AG788]
MWKSMTDRYGSVAVTIHWLSAIVTVVALLSGFRAAHAIDEATRAELLRTHIPAAIIVLLLTLLRMVWWLLVDQKPQPAAGMPRWQAWSARAVHIGFYVIILGMVASGIGMLLRSGAGPAVFSEMPAHLPNFHASRASIPHGIGARVLLALLATHVGAALYHHFIRRDGLIWRMSYASSRIK